MNSHAHTHVTPLKTPLKHTQIPQAMITIRTLINIILYVSILLPLILFFLSSIIYTFKELRAWAQGEEDPQE